MTYSLDFELGTLPKDRVFNDEVYANCRCDGQFSDSIICRGAYNEMFYSYNLSSGLNFDFYFHSSPRADIDGYRWLTDRPDTHCPTKARPFFVLLNGGTHFFTNFTSTYALVVEGSMQQVKQLMKECSLPLKEKTIYFRFAYFGVPAISHEMGLRYPYHNGYNATTFNSQMQHKLAESYPEVVYMDFWNITKDAAENRTSDGFHKLSDVSVLQATTLLNIMRTAIMK